MYVVFYIGQNSEMEVCSVIERWFIPRVSFPALGEVLIDHHTDNNRIKFHLMRVFRLGYEDKGNDVYRGDRICEVGRFLYIGFLSIEWKPRGWLFWDNPF